MSDVDTSPAALRALAEAATPGPWQVDITRHPYSMVRLNGSFAEGEHVERWIQTVRIDPQAKAPHPIVVRSVGIAHPGEPAITMVHIRPEDADYLAAVSPEVVLGLLDTIDGLRASLAAAEKERDEAHEAYEKLADPSLNWMRLENGQLDMAVAGAVVQHIAATMAGWFRESGAENYVEMSLNARDEPFERYVVTVQKVGRLSPHEARVAAVARAEKAEAERDEARKVIAWANNSLYGSHGFFLSLDGGPANEHHLDNGIEELKDIVRRKFSNGTAMIWQPIETAPRDGTLIDLWSSRERIANCAWNVPSACWAERIGVGFGGKHWAVVSAPTHWMPLPAAPANPEDPAHD